MSQTPDRMRVGVYVHELRPDAGGAHTLQADIVDALARIPCVHELFVFHGGPERPSERGAASFVSLAPYVRSRRRPWMRMKRGASLLAGSGVAGRVAMRHHPLREAASDRGIDLLWYLTLDTPVVELPFVATVWDLAHRMLPMFPEVSTTGWTWDMRESLFRHALPRATCVVTGTGEGKSQVERFYGVTPDRIEIIPFPTPSFALRADKKAPDAPPLAEPYLFYPAVFWPHKNHVVLLHALRRLRDGGRTLAAVFSGTAQGNHEHVLATARRLGIESQLHFPGFVTRDELVAYYRHAAVLVFPSLFGPDNLPPLEAFALECPVIGGDIPGAREQLGDAALLVDPTDEQAWADAIGRVLGDAELRSTLVEKGRKRALAWTADDYVRRMHTTIDGIAKLRRCWP